MADLYKEQLIMCVKGFPVLYNHQMSEYRDIMAKGKCWEIIASQLGRDGKLVFIFPQNCFDLSATLFHKFSASMIYLVHWDYIVP